MMRVFDGTRNYPDLLDDSPSETCFTAGQIIYVDLGSTRAIDRLRIVVVDSDDNTTSSIPHKIELAYSVETAGELPNVSDAAWRWAVTLSCSGPDGEINGAREVVLPFSPIITRFTRIAFVNTHAGGDATANIRELSFPPLDEDRTDAISAAHSLLESCDAYLEALQQMRDDKVALDACTPVLQASKGLSTASATVTELVAFSARLANDMQDLEVRVRNAATNMSSIAQDAREIADRVGPLPSWRT